VSHSIDALLVSVSTLLSQDTIFHDLTSVFKLGEICPGLAGTYSWMLLIDIIRVSCLSIEPFEK
jgi:hypothetical protein